jgi:hypothetical protein
MQNSLIYYSGKLCIFEMYSFHPSPIPKQKPVSLPLTKKQE